MPTTLPMLDVIKQAAGDERGALKRLADKLGIRHQSFYSWNRVPAERVLDFEQATGIPKHMLRPDLYPPPAAKRVNG